MFCLHAVFLCVKAGYFGMAMYFFFISKAVHDLIMNFHGFPLLRSAKNISFSVLQNLVSELERIRN